LRRKDFTFSLYFILSIYLKFTPFAKTSDGHSGPDNLAPETAVAKPPLIKHNARIEEFVYGLCIRRRNASCS
jgi:hypothetical protein